MSASNDLRVTIAVLTFRRNEPLIALLPQLLTQLDSVPNPGRVLVVDNDPAGDARESVTAFGDPRVVYAHEPEPGIVAGRNHALDASSDDDLLIFIDDDERPTDTWLMNLLRVYDQHRSAGVVGNVLREYETPPNDFIQAGRFFDRDPIPTGTSVHAAGTGNLLLDLNQIRQMQIRFDPVFSLSGGSDTMFTREIVRAGGKLIWCADADVIELIPASRLTREWVLQRAFRIGNGGSRTAIAVAETPTERAKARVTSLGNGVARVLGGGVRVLQGTITRSLETKARGMRTFMRGSGMVSGAIGYHHDKEYRKSRAAALGSSS